MNHAAADTVAVADPDVAARFLEKHPGKILAAHSRRRIAVHVLQTDQRRRSLGGKLGLLLGVHGGRIAPLVTPIGDFGTEARRDVARDLFDLLLDHVLDRLFERADRAAQYAFLRDNVPGIAGMDLRRRDDGCVHRIEVARHDRLQRRHDVRTDHDRVDAMMGHGAVRTDAFHDDLENIVGCHHRAGTDGETANRNARDVVHAVHAFDGELLEQPLLDHDAATAFVLFGRLEDEVDRTVEVLGLREVLGGTQQHHRVAVMAAGMHLAGNRRLVVELVGLVNVERIHVGTQADSPLRRPAAQDADHARLGQAAMHFEAERLQLLGDDIGSPHFLEGRLRVAVDVVTPRRHVFVERGNAVDDRHLKSPK